MIMATVKTATALGVLLVSIVSACERAVPARHFRVSAGSPSRDLIIIRPMATAIDAANVPGCYAASWAPAQPFPSFQTSGALSIPRRFELEAASQEAVGPPAGTIVNRLGAVHYRSTKWEIEGTHLRMWWGTGFVGIKASAELPAAGGLLSGQAETFSDDGSAKQIAKIRLQRISC